jgi:hypothetical protein
MEERGRVGVVPNQDREVAEASLPADRLPRDEIRDRFRLFDTGDLLDVVDIDFVRYLATAKSFVDAEGRFETLGILGDQAVGGIEQAL